MDTQITVDATAELATISLPNLATILPKAKAKAKKPKLTPIERLDARTDTSGGENACHECSYSPPTDGYPMISVKGRNIRVSIFAWEHAHGPVPDGMHVLHTCNNPKCRNINHLFIGDRRENMAQMQADGRRGKALPVATVKEIVKLGIFDGMKAPAIAAIFKVNPVTVRDILRGRRRANLTGIPRNQGTRDGRDLAFIQGEIAKFEAAKAAKLKPSKRRGIGAPSSVAIH